jgi:hypothetical protein
MAFFVATRAAGKRICITGKGRGLGGTSGAVASDMDCIIIIRPVYLYVLYDTFTTGHCGTVSINQYLRENRCASDSLVCIRPASVHLASLLAGFGQCIPYIIATGVARRTPLAIAKDKVECQASGGKREILPQTDTFEYLIPPLPEATLNCLPKSCLWATDEHIG